MEPLLTLKVFICVLAVCGPLLIYDLPEIKGVPLEEMGKLFGDNEDVTVFLEDIHFDEKTDELVIQAHDGSGISRIATSPRKSLHNEHVEES
jgi:L-arabinose isomerase